MLRAQGLSKAHGPTAGGAQHHRWSGVRAGRDLRPVGGLGGGGQTEQVPGQVEPVTLAGGEEAVVANFLEALGQEVLQEAADELLGGEGAGLPVAGGAVAVAKGDLTLVQFEDTVVGEGHPEDVRGQIVEGGLTGANRLAMDDPVLPPGRGWGLVKQLGLAQSGPELGSKEAGQGFDVDKKGITSRSPGLTIRG